MNTSQPEQTDPRMSQPIRIGTRDSQLAIWQATRVQELLAQFHFPSELVYIKSEGDIDLHTPLYEMGVQGIFTRSLDIALLSGKIDIAVHSMKDVPTRLPDGIVQAAVLQRASYKDILVYKKDSIPGFDWNFFHAANQENTQIQLPPFTIATSSIRRRAQWLHRFPGHRLENLRGNVNTRLRKLAEHDWNGAVFAAAGLERIGLRPDDSLELDWMLPAPAQGAIMVVCREGDFNCLDASENFNDSDTALCVQAERDFLRTLMGGCTTPISALATIQDGQLFFRGSLLSVDGKKAIEVTRQADTFNGYDIGIKAGREVLEKGGREILEAISGAGK